METMLNIAADEPTDFFSLLPDDIILEILSKLIDLKSKQIDLKSLCFCKLVSRRFYSIVNNTKVEAVSLSYRKPLISSSTKKSLLLLKPFKFLSGIKHIDPFENKSFRSAYMFMCNFRQLRNLHIQLPACVKGIENSRSLFKWRAEYRKNNVDSFVFLSPNSIYDNNGLLLYRGRGLYTSGDLEESYCYGSYLKKRRLAHACFTDMMIRIWVLLNCTVDFPLLEKVCVTHSDKKGTVSFSREKLTELRRKGACYPSEHLIQMVRTGLPLMRMNRFAIPVLELPVSGYVMKGVYLFILTMADDHHDVVIDRFINNNGDNNDDVFEDKLEAAYSEAMMKILTKHRKKLRNGWFNPVADPGILV